MGAMYDHAEMDRLYHLKKSDSEIAATIGCTHANVYAFRKRRGYPPNMPQGYPQDIIHKNHRRHKNA